MTRFRVVFILFVLTLIGAFNTRREIYWATTGALFGMMVASVAWAYLSVNWLRVGRRTLTRVAQVGQVLEEEFVIANLSRIPKLWLEVRDSSTLPFHYASRVLGSVLGGNRRGWRVQTVCTARGRFTLGPLTVTSGDPLGIYQRTRKLDHTASILVYPATYELRSFPLRSNVSGGGESLRKRTPHVTTNAAGVREYVMGDSLNRIHWPLSMRRGHMVVKEFELDPAAEFWVLLDLYAQGHTSAPEIDADDAPDTVELMPVNDDIGPVKPKAQADFALPPSTAEYAISIAASIAKHFLNQNKMLGMLTYASGTTQPIVNKNIAKSKGQRNQSQRELVQPDRGDRQLNKILERLAMVQAQGDVPFDRVLRAEAMHLPRGSTIVLISASPDPAWATIAGQLSRSGGRVVVVLIDPRTFNPAAPAIDPVLTALNEGGTAVRVVRYGDNFGDVLA